MDTGIFIGDKVITTSWDKIWNKPTTLSGYGITDAVTIDTAQEIYGIKTFKSTTTISTALDVKLILQSLDADNYCMIKVQDQNSQDLSYIGYLGNNWYTDGNLILNSSNYTGELDNRYVNKAGDTMTGKLLFNANSGIDLVSIPRTKSAISFNNAGVNRIGINFTDGDGNLRIARTDINQDWVSGDVNILLGSNNYKVWHAGNDGSGSGLDADLLDGKHLGNVGDRVMRQIGFPYYNEFGSNDTNVYLRKVLGWCYNNVNTGADDSLFIGVGHPNALGNMQIQVYCNSGINEEGYPRYSTGVYFPLDSNPIIFGTTENNYWQKTLACISDNVASATRLVTSRSIYGNPFDGTSDIPVTAIGKMRFLYFTKDDGSELGYVGKGSDRANNLEFINYEGSLILGANNSDDVIITTNHNVGIGTTNAAHKLHVEGDIYATNGFSETSDIRKKKVLSPHTVNLDDMAYADLFNYTLIDDEKEIVRVGTNAHYWLDKLPQVVTKDSDEYLSLNYGVLGTVCALSVSKYVKQLEDRVTLLENKIASLQ